MVIDRHDKIYVTSDAATIVRELEIEHPAAKILVFAAQRQVFATKGKDLPLVSFMWMILCLDRRFLTFMVTGTRGR
tara:strand:+ start:787 stop:1014 length:228 start_codon:yes stop_codon:yes gene_type:complete